MKETIRAERARRGWSQEDLAEHIGMHLSTVKNIEGQYDYKRIPAEPLRAIDQAFEWPAGTLERKLRDPVDTKTTTPVNGPDREYDEARPSMTEPDLIKVLDHIVLDVVAHTRPETTIAELKEMQARALRIAHELGLGEPRRRQSKHEDDDSER